MGAEDFDEQEAGADDDAAVGYVEVGPVVVDDVDFEEVDDVVEADAVVEVAEAPPRMSARATEVRVRVAADAPEHAEDER